MTDFAEIFPSVSSEGFQSKLSDLDIFRVPIFSIVNSE